MRDGITEPRESRGEIDGVGYTVKTVRPYNFWIIRPDAGEPPAECRGVFTSEKEAVEAFTNYLARAKTTRGSIHFEPTPPKIKVVGKKKEYVVLEDEDPKEE